MLVEEGGPRVEAKRERRGPPSSGQVQSHIPGASGQRGVALGCLAERETANRTPESDIRTPERHTHCDTQRPMSVLALNVLRRCAGGCLGGQGGEVVLDLVWRDRAIAFPHLRWVHRHAEHAEVAREDAFTRREEDA